MDTVRTVTAPTLDLFKLERYLTDEHIAMRDAVRDFVQTQVLPNISPYWDRAEFPREIALGIKNLPIIGGVLRGYECAGMDALGMGLAMFELAKGDGSISTFYGVHSGLAMASIGFLGSDEQRARWLPPMARPPTRKRPVFG